MCFSEWAGLMLLLLVIISTSLLIIHAKKNVVLDFFFFLKAPEPKYGYQGTLIPSTPAR